MSSLSTLPKGDSAWLLRKAVERIMQQVSVLETNIGSSTTGNSANTEIIFNDAGTLRGDAGLTYNKTTDALTITGDLTVATNGLKVDSTNKNVGINTATPTNTAGYKTLEIVGTGVNTAGMLRFKSSDASVSTLDFADSNGRAIFAISNHPVRFGCNDIEQYRIAASGVFTWYDGAGGTRMTLNSTGLGVGGSPTSKLTIGTGSFSAAASGTTGMYTTASGLEMLSDSYFFGSRAGGGLMTLDASGNLLVGTTSQPSGVTLSRATIKSTSADWSSVIWNSNATPYGFRIQYDTDSNATGNEFLYCLGAANLRASIRSNGGIANYQANDVSLSDSRMKSDIKPLGSYWNKIKSLEIVTFKYKDQTHNDDNIGLIAQQVESVAPEFVDVDGFGNTPEDGVPLKTIYTTDLYHAAIKALQEAMTRIEVLESKLA